jgi:site-specific recombinase XerD
VFFRWAVNEDEISASPMDKMSPPIVPEEPVGLVSDDDMRKLLKVCDGKTFEDRRDTAIMRLFFDTAIRRAEPAGLTVADIDLDHRVVTVLGKGRRPRSVPFGTNAAKALDLYLRARESHALASTRALWLGTSSRGFSDVAVRQMLKRRGAQAGVDRLHAHAFRHGFAHAHLSEGGHESDLMMLAGWKSRQMLSRYGASVAADRAKKNYTSPGDRL